MIFMILCIICFSDVERILAERTVWICIKIFIRKRLNIHAIVDEFFMVKIHSIVIKRNVIKNKNNKI